MQPACEPTGLFRGRPVISQTLATLAVSSFFGSATGRHLKRKPKRFDCYLVACYRTDWFDSECRRLCPLQCWAWDGKPVPFNWNLGKHLGSFLFSKVVGAVAAQKPCLSSSHGLITLRWSNMREFACHAGWALWANTLRGDKSQIQYIDMLECFPKPLCCFHWSPRCFFQASRLARRDRHASECISKDCRCEQLTIQDLDRYYWPQRSGPTQQ